MWNSFQSGFFFDDIDLVLERTFQLYCFLFKISSFGRYKIKLVILWRGSSFFLPSACKISLRSGCFEAKEIHLSLK